MVGRSRCSSVEIAQEFQRVGGNVRPRSILVLVLVVKCVIPVIIVLEWEVGEMTQKVRHGTSGGD